MDATLLEGLRDPAGLPFYPQVFMALSVLTFALHIFVVQIMLGATGVTIWGAFSKNAHARKLGMAMLNVAKISVSVAIVLGVAPLLFVQVIYDPFWYASNVLSARWVIGFIIVLIFAYLAMYTYYFGNYGADSDAPRKRVWAILASLALFLVVGSIMHVLSREMLFPEEWKTWYAPNGEIDPSGSNFKAFAPFRFAFFIFWGIPAVGAYLVAYAAYFSVRDDFAKDYLDFATDLGRKLMLVGTGIVLVLGAGWMATLPDTAAGFGTSVWVWLAALAILAFGAFGYSDLTRHTTWALMAPVVGTVAALVIAIGRQALREVILHGSHGYDYTTYKVNMDIYSTALFFGTFAIVGGLVLTYLIGLVWNAGRTQGVYTPGPVLDRIGTAAIWSIGLWVVQFFAFGFYIWAQ